MRSSIDAGTLALYTSGAYDLHTKLTVENGDDTPINIDGRYAKIVHDSPTPSKPIANIKVTFLREQADGPSKSLAPMIEESTYNKLDDESTYSPLLQIGRVVVLEIALSAVGGARPSDVSGLWYEIFTGYITDVNWPNYDSPLGTITCNDLGGVLQVHKSESPYTYTASTSIETVASQILTNNGLSSFVTLYFPSATGKVLPVDYAPGYQKTVWSQLWGLAQSMGWVCFFRYRGQNPVELTFFEPSRTKTVSDMTLPRWWDFKQLDLSDDEVRNVGFLVYYDEDGSQNMLGPYVDSASIAKYGGSLGIRRQFWIVLELTSPIRSASAAADMLNAALSDVADPDIIATIRTQPLVFGEVSTDLYTIPEYGKFFDTDQKLAPFGIRTVIEPGFKAHSELSVRGVPTAGIGTWKELDVSYVPPIVSPLVSQTGSTGTLELLIKDVQSNVQSVWFKTYEGGTGDYDFTNYESGVGGGWTEDAVAPYSTTVPLSEDHQSAIAWAVEYTDENGGTSWLTGVEFFDSDLIPNFTASLTRENDTVYLQHLGDNDLACIGYVTSESAIPGDMTGATFVNSRAAQTAIATGVSGTLFVRVRGYSGADGTGTPSEEDWVAQIGTSGITIPTVKVIPTQSGSPSYGNVTLEVYDPNGLQTGSAFDPVIGGVEHDPGDPLTWDEVDTSGPGYETAHSTGVLITEKHNSAMFWGVRYSPDGGTTQKWITGSHTFDIDLLPNFSAGLTLEGSQAKLSWIGDEDLKCFEYVSSLSGPPADFTGSSYTNDRTGLVNIGSPLSSGETLYVLARGWSAVDKGGNPSAENWSSQIQYAVAIDDLPPMGIAATAVWRPHMAGSNVYIATITIQVGGLVKSVNISVLAGSSWNYNEDIDVDTDHDVEGDGTGTTYYWSASDTGDPVVFNITPYDAIGGSGGSGTPGIMRKVFLMPWDESGIGVLTKNQAGTEFAGGRIIPKTMSTGTSCIEFETPASDGTIKIKLKVDAGTAAPTGTPEDGQVYFQY